jgi:hypothetical protein
MSRRHAAALCVFLAAIIGVLALTGTIPGRNLAILTPSGAGNTASSGLMDAAFSGVDGGVYTSSITTSGEYYSHILFGLDVRTVTGGTVHVQAEVSPDGTNWYPVQRCSNVDAGIQTCKTWQADFAVTQPNLEKIPISLDVDGKAYRLRIWPTSATGFVTVRGFKSEQR